MPVKKSSTAAPRVAKKSATKKPARKSRAALSSSMSAATPSADPLITMIDDPEPEMPPMPGPTDESRVVFSKSCRRCGHLPVGLNAIMSMLVGLVVILSVGILAATVVIDSQGYQLNAFNNGGISFLSFDE